MQFTNNYNLKKPGYSDIADIPEHFNDNMDTIDAKLKENADNISNLEGTGRTTETVKGNSDSIASLSGEGRTTETVKKNADDIGTLSTQMADLATKEELNAHKAESVSQLIVISRDLSISGEQVISTNRKIKSIVANGIVAATIKTSRGFLSSGQNPSCVYIMPANGYYNANDNALLMFSNNDTIDRTYCRVTNITETSFTLNWLKTGVGTTGTANISLLVQCHGED